MTRRLSIAVGAVVALASMAGLIGLSGLLATDRRRDLDRYQDAIAQQRREAGQAAPRLDSTRPLARETVFCVTGVDTLAVTLHDALGAPLVDASARLAPAELRRVSSLALRAARYLEQAHAGPALPQRMGRAIAPPTVECEGKVAYAAFRLDPQIGFSIPAGK